mmetsp:Transcript_168285/g.540665  ORF Transcript_168285/g.540665 Transcript_168285/m.540665 type:complete len:392 (+) Transcript_168285:87-1262(+)
MDSSLMKPSDCEKKITAAAGSAGAVAMPRPPTMPKPNNLPPIMRHKFVNFSISSLPTVSVSKDSLPEDHTRLSLESDSEDQDGLGLESDSEDESELERKGITEEDIRRVYGGVQPKKTDVAEGEAASEKDTDSLSRCTDLSQDRFEVFDSFDDNGMPKVGPLLNLEDGIRAPIELPRCPPLAWLHQAGFDVPSSRGFDSVPVGPVCGERPTQYLNLFSRQMIARQRTSDLTVGALRRHEIFVGRARHTDTLPLLQQGEADEEAPVQNGQWLEVFLATARAMPLTKLTDTILGSDLGVHVAAFLDCLDDGSDAGATIASEDQPDGLFVTAPKILQRPLYQGRGRAGFMVDNDFAVEAPGRSQSPQPRNRAVFTHAEVPPPPLIRAPRASRVQ